MKIQSINKKEYGSLFEKFSLSFMQSVEWAEVKEPTWNNEFLNVDGYPVLLLSRSIPGTKKKFAYIPRLFSDEDVSIEILKSIRDYLSTQSQYSHVDIDMGITEISLQSEFNELGFVSSGEQLQPQFTNIIDIGIKEEDLLASFKSSTRNKINKASKLSATVEVLESGQDAVDRFYNIMKSVVQLTDYVSHSKDYYQKIWDLFSKDQRARIIIVSIDGNDFGTYFSILNDEYQWEVFGGMNKLGREIRGAGYFLKWESIKAAISSGQLRYDQWGVAPKVGGGGYDESHRFYRIGEFKKEFNGVYTEFISQQTYVFDNKSYTLFRTGKIIQSLIVKIKKFFK
jgi:lipid II:glycine glycyltransferase (peptidoglycan interpeptide bridge formation enzyme)